MSDRLTLASGAVTLETVNGRAELAMIDHDGNGSARFLSHRDLVALQGWISQRVWRLDAADYATLASVAPPAP